MDNKDIKILEAILFASGEPLDENDLKEKINDKNNISKQLQEIKDFYKNRGINLIKTGNKWSFRTAESIKDDLTIFKTQKRKLVQNFYLSVDQFFFSSKLIYLFDQRLP